jgi:hypothetical protein
MNKTLVEKAKSLCKNCGVSESNLTVAINTIGGHVADDCTDATEIDKVANEILTVAKAMQSEASSRVEDFKKKNPVKNVDDKPVDDDKNDDDTGKKSDDLAASIKAAVEAAMKPLKDELAQYREKDVSKTRLDALNEKLSTCKDEQFKAQALKAFKRMKFESDDEFNEYLTETETDIASANQSVSDNELRSNGAPMFNKKNDDGVSSAVAGYIDNQKKGDDNQFAGKSL